MSRLFVTDRELRLFADITRELTRDVIGSRIFYFPVSALKTRVDDVYNEADQKVFDNPIEIHGLVHSEFNDDTQIDEFGVDAKFRLEVYLQWRDLIESGITVSIGDYFRYGDVLYEIVDSTFIKTIYGQVEHKDGIKVTGVKARKGAIDAPVYGPTDIKYSDEGAVQHEFTQSRGKEEDDDEKPTGDVRELVRDGVLDKPIEGPRSVKPHADKRTTIRKHGERGGTVSSFYDEDGED